MSPRPIISKELSREQILQAARERFIEIGYRAVSMRALALSLACSHGAIYYHFKDKAELYYRVIEQDFDRLLALLEETVKDRKFNMQLLHEILAGYIRFGLDHPQSYEMMFMMNDEELECRYEADQKRCYNRFSETVQLCLDCQNEAGANMAWMLFLGLHGFVSKHITMRHSYDEVSEQVNEYVSFLLRGK